MTLERLILLCCLLFCVYTQNVESMTTILDLIDIPWTEVNSTNGATYQDFLSLTESNMAFNFTEDVTYNITELIFVPLNGYLCLSTSPGIKVTFNIPEDISFLLLDNGVVSINGNFVFEGLHNNVTNVDNPQLSTLPINVNLGMVYIEGAIFQNFVTSNGVIQNNVGTIKLDSVLFRNNIGNTASTIWNNAGTLLLNDIRVENSSVTPSLLPLEENAQIWNNGGALYFCDNFIMLDNNGTNVNCGTPLDSFCGSSQTFCNNNQIQWTEIDSTIAPTYEDFYRLVTNHQGQSSTAYQFTESMNYTVSQTIEVFSGMFYLSTACGVKVIFNLPNSQIVQDIPQQFIGINSGSFLNITGDFIVQSESTANNVSSTDHTPIIINTANAYIEGLVLQNFGVASENAAITSGDFTLGLKSVTFNNIKGIDASAFYGFDGPLILTDVLIKDSSVNSTGTGKQINGFDTGIYGGSVFVENNFPPDSTDCANNIDDIIDLICSFSVVNANSTDSNSWEFHCNPNSANNDNDKTADDDVDDDDKSAADDDKSSNDDDKSGNDDDKSGNDDDKSGNDDDKSGNDDDSNSNIQWLYINSTNGATWDDFYQLWQQNSMTTEGDFFMFTQSLTYTLSEGQGLVISDQQNVTLSTSSSDITITINVPNGTYFLFQDGNAFLEINGDFVIQGDDSASNQQFPFIQFQNANNAKLYGTTIQNYYSTTEAAVVILQGTMTMTSTTFKNCNAPLASAISQTYGDLTFNDITVESCSVSSNNGAQLFSDYGTMSGSVTFKNNHGNNYICEEGATCSISTANTPTDDDDGSNDNGNSHASGKIAAIVVSIVIFICCCIGGAFSWLGQNKRNGKRQPLLEPSMTLDQVQGSGSVQSQYQQF